MEKVKKPIQLPSVLVSLGRAVEVRCGDVDVRYKWCKNDNVMLYSSVDGKQLFCAKTKKKSVNREHIEMVCAKRKTSIETGLTLYQKWHDFEAYTGSLLSVPKGFLFRRPRATTIIYASDKWTGKITRYIHAFKTPPVCWVNRKTRPTLLVLTGGKIRVRKDGITG